MYEYSPKQDNRKAKRLIPLFLVGGALLVFIPAVGGLPFAALFQLIGVGLLTAAIFLATRYVSKRLVYCVREGEGSGTDFEVTEVQSNGRRLTVCRIATADIEEIITLRGEDRASLRALRERIRKEGRKLYQYCPDLAPEAVTYLLVKEQLGGPVAIALCPDETLLTLLDRGRGLS